MSIFHERGQLGGKVLGPLSSRPTLLSVTAVALVSVPPPSGTRSSRVGGGQACGGSIPLDGTVGHHLSPPLSKIFGCSFRHQPRGFSRLCGRRLGRRCAGRRSRLRHRGCIGGRQLGWWPNRWHCGDHGQVGTQAMRGPCCRANRLGHLARINDRRRTRGQMGRPLRNRRRYRQWVGLGKFGPRCRLRPSRERQEV